MYKYLSVEVPQKINRKFKIDLNNLNLNVLIWSALWKNGLESYLLWHTTYKAVHLIHSPVIHAQQLITYNCDNLSLIYHHQKLTFNINLSLGVIFHSFYQQQHAAIIDGILLSVKMIWRRTKQAAFEASLSSDATKSRVSLRANIFYIFILFIVLWFQLVERKLLIIHSSFSSYWQTVNIITMIRLEWMFRIDKVT